MPNRHTDHSTCVATGCIFCYALQCGLTIINCKSTFAVRPYTYNYRSDYVAIFYNLPVFAWITGIMFAFLSPPLLWLTDSTLKIKQNLAKSTIMCMDCLHFVNGVSNHRNERDVERCNSPCVASPARNPPGRPMARRISPSSLADLRGGARGPCPQDARGDI